MLKKSRSAFIACEAVVGLSIMLLTCLLLGLTLSQYCRNLRQLQRQTNGYAALATLVQQRETQAKLISMTVRLDSIDYQTDYTANKLTVKSEKERTPIEIRW